jgi:hypothetical protein
MVKKRTFSSAKTQDDMKTNVATTEDSEAYETVNTEDDTDNEEMTLRPTTSKATADAKYSDDNEEYIVGTAGLLFSNCGIMGLVGSF